MGRSLRTKLVLIMVLLITSVMTVVGAFLVNGVSSFYVNSFYEQMNTIFSTEFISELDVLSADGPERLKTALMSATGLGIDVTGRNVYILDSGANVLAGSDEAESVSVTGNLLKAMEGGVGQSRSVISTYMDVAIPIGEEASPYIVYVIDNRATADALSADVLIIILQALALGLVISIALSFLLAEILITPVENLTNGARRVAEGDFSQKLSVHSRDEIGVLTVTFNEMAGVLQSTLEEVENERNKLSTLFLHMTDGVVAFARDGSVIHFNPAAKQMLDYGFDDGAVYEDIFGELSPLGDILALKRPEFIESQLSLGKRDLEVFLASFSDEDSQGGVLAVIHDVTEQHKTEQVRREFVANVSHELRTPLTNIKSYAETLSDSEGLPPEMQERFLGVILSETDRMTHIVQDLLTLSRFDYGRMEMKFSAFSLKASVLNICEAVKMDCARRSHQLTLDADADIPEITGDRERVEQVIMNIASNAIKYTPDGGKIHISLGSDESFVWVKVSDNGIGIPEKDIPRLFERFYRVDKARSRESGGTGLGLSIAQEIISLHKGFLDVRSKLGEGTEVVIRLPLDSEARE